MGKEQQGSKAAKAGLGYTIGNYCIRGIGFITVPIFSRLLSTSDFGLYNTFLAYEAVVYIFISLALNSSVKNAKYKFPKCLDEYTSSVALLPLILLAVILVISFPIRNILSTAFGLDYFCIILLFLYSYCSGLVIYYRARIGLDYEYKEYLGLSAFNALANVAFSLLLIFTVYREEKYLGRILGGTLVQVVLAIYILFRLFFKAKPRVKFKYWKFGLKISIPLIPHALSQIVLVQFDRIMISKIIGTAEAGIYSFAYTIYSLVQITATSLESAYSPWAFQAMHEGKKNELIRVGTAFMLFIGGITAGVTLLAPEFIYLLGGNKYAEAYTCTVPVLVAGFFAMSYTIPVVVEYYKEKTSYISVGTAVAALINICLNALFIPKYGYVAAAYTTLISYIVYFSIHVIIARKLAGFHIIRIKYLISVVAIITVSGVVALYYHDKFTIRMGTFIVMLAIGIPMLIKVYGLENIKNLLGTKGK